jgi:predicted ester cyclase
MTENENKEKPLCHPKTESLSFVAIPKRFRVVATLKCSKSSSPPISSIIRPSRAALLRIATAREIYTALRAAFPDFHAEIHWQISDGDRVTTYKTYHGTHEGTFWGLAPTGRKIHFETVDVMRVRNGKITDHWGVANLFSLMQQLGLAPALNLGKKDLNHA